MNDSTPSDAVELKEELCPIPGAHQRLEEAHRLWHRAADAYEDPDEFRANLNALIQALRSVTFVLQNEKRAIENFDDWYRPWQDVMRQDAVLAWSVGARNRVVHQGDLETHSTATVWIQASWDAPITTTFQVPPFVPTIGIAALLAEQGIPDDIRKQGILVVERRWVSSDLPEWELLDALAHCYEILVLLIKAAHRQAGAAMHALGVPHDPGDLTETLGGRPPCMVASHALRTVRVHLGTNEIIQAALRPILPGREAEAAERYELTGIEPPTSGDPLDMAPYYMEIAKRILSVDGYHVQMVFLFRPDGRMTSMVTMPEDQQAKYVFMNDGAAGAARFGAEGLVLIADSWWLPNADDLPDGMRVSEFEGRQEALSVTAARSDGDSLTLTTPYERRESEIVFDETVESSGEGQFILGAVYKVWGIARPGESEFDRTGRLV